MAKDQARNVEVDERFFIPAGVVDVRRVGETDASSLYKPGDIADLEGSPPPSGDDDIPPSPLAPPSSYKIVEQKVRIASDGRAVVDVILEFPDTPGVDSVDVRITKA